MGMSNTVQFVHVNGLAFVGYRRYCRTFVLSRECTRARGREVTGFQEPHPLGEPMTCAVNVM